jgi:hypothetical protein
MMGWTKALGRLYLKIGRYPRSAGMPRNPHTLSFVGIVYYRFPYYTHNVWPNGSRNIRSEHHLSEKSANNSLPLVWRIDIIAFTTRLSPLPRCEVEEETIQ